MAITEGYSGYACDVLSCEHSDYALPDTDKADSYVIRRRYDDNGVLREIVLCSEHNETYAKLLKTCEGAYRDFERDGSFTLATKADVDALNEQLEKLQADYDAVRSNRDSWVRKYNELAAEFEQYKKDHPDNEAGDA